MQRAAVLLLVPHPRGLHRILALQISRYSRLALIAGLFAFGSMAFVGDLGQAYAAADATVVDRKKDTKEKPVSAVAWKKIPAAEKVVLAPLEPEWASLPGHQQRKLLGAAKHYPMLSTVEQERFHERLKSWSSLTPEQRTAARDKYQLLTSLPPEKQQELKARWHQEKTSPATQPAPPTPASAK